MDVSSVWGRALETFFYFYTSLTFISEKYLYKSNNLITFAVGIEALLVKRRKLQQMLIKC